MRGAQLPIAWKMERLRHVRLVFTFSTGGVMTTTIVRLAAVAALAAFALANGLIIVVC